MDVFEAIRTTRAMRRLDPTVPVTDEQLWTILGAAHCAPSGGNAQWLRWVVVTDAERRARLGEIYRACWAPVRRRYDDRVPADPEAAEKQARMLRSADHLAEHMGEAPVLIVPVTTVDEPSSVFPAVQNLMLAARALGLGTTLTTTHRHAADEVRKVLGLPPDAITWALIPVGVPTGRWGEARRRPLESVVYWDTWEATR
ncbi:nitroreductase family protein [Micromonospora profundi]|uniref:nitroreductase family protein n=1 Tax=Micromonospora TaxID=1873 RepID=UPI0033BEDB73